MSRDVSWDTSVTDVDRRSGERDEPEPEGLASHPVRRWIGDLAALLPLVVLLPGLAGRDGGRGFAATLLLAMATVPALPVAWFEVRRLPRVAVGLLAAWTGALTLGVVAARYRADMVVPLLQYTIAPVLLLAARRVWRRPWGPATVLGLLGLALGRYQVRSWLDWWAQTEGGTGFWRPLSWRNPSAALTGMLGVWFLGVSLMSTRLIRVGMGFLAAIALAGTWLSSSRAGLAVTVGAVIVVLALAGRAARAHGRSVIAPLAAGAAVMFATAGLVAALVSMQPSGTGQALAERDQSVEQNTLARIEHSEAALGMFFDRPLTGQGLGSYKAMARQWNDPNGNLTSSAHNEYAEVAGETGVLGGVALLGVLVGLAWVGLSWLRDPPPPGSLTDLRPGLVVGGIGAVALFLVHSGLDFDWNYPVLSGMAALGAAIMLPDVPRRSVGRSPTSGVIGLLSLLLIIGLALGHAERIASVPWDGERLVALGHEALEEDRVAEALSLADAALRWNPGSPAARSLAALARFEATGDASSLIESIEGQPAWFDGRARAAMALAHSGHEDRARQVLENLHNDLDTYKVWGVASTRLLAVEAEVALAARQSCAAAFELVGSWTSTDDASRPLPTFAPEVLADRLAAEGCASD